MAPHVFPRWRLFLLTCAIAALTACGGASPTDAVTAPPPTVSVPATRIVGTVTGTGTGTSTATASVTAAVASGSTTSRQATGTTPPGTPIAFQTPAVGVSASGVGRLEVQFDGTFEAVCIYRIAGTGLMPRTQIDEVGAHGEKVQHGPVAADGTYTSSPIYQDPLHSGTLSATARDGSAVTTQYLVPCSPPGAGHA